MAAGKGALAYGFAILIAAGALVADPGAPAARAASVCSGRPLRTVPFSTGEVRVYKGRDYACAVTVAKKPGKKRSMSISLQSRGGNPVLDRGQFTRQAGPVTVHALNRCVRATGSVSGTSVSTGWILC
ncbi:hypothetical protein [Streptomyces corynorhini]|uniref:hypothetical protein n=1 Tax=Streptomyces corynorhini TaxID=2282652 RepID=UPI001F2137C4|nr:hypothetical protein [Streptomyces corynorhini]